MASTTPDVRILVGNLGDASPSGESANLIRNNLQAALSASPIKAKVIVDTTGSETSTAGVRAMSQATAQLTTARQADAAAAQRQSTAQAQNIKVTGEAATVTEKAAAAAAKMQSGLERLLVQFNPSTLAPFTEQIGSINTLLEQGTAEACDQAKIKIMELKAALETAVSVPLAADKAATTAFTMQTNFKSYLSGFRAEDLAPFATTINEINTLLGQGTVESCQRADVQIKQLKATIEATVSAPQRLAEAAEKAGIAMQELAGKISSTQANFTKYLTTVNPKALTQFSAEINSINALLNQGTAESFKKATAQITSLKAAIETAGYSGGNAITFLTSKLKSFGVYLASSAITMGIISSVRTMITNVKDLDAALTDLRIVTGATREDTEELLSTYNKMAQQLGTTTTSVASGAVDWLRQGYSEEDARELLKQSMTLSIVGDMDSAAATDALTSAMKGYSLTVSEASDVVDKFFSVDMVAATSSEDMALALAKTAANAKLAGLSLDDVIGQLARVNEVMKEDGSSTGGTMRLAA